MRSAATRALLRWQDWDEAASEQFGRVKAALVRKGEVIEDMDLAITAITLAIKAQLATRNIKYFKRIHGLRVEDRGAVPRAS